MTSSLLDPKVAHQFWAIIRRYGISLRRKPLRSLVRIVLWPAFLIGFTVYLMEKLKSGQFSDMRSEFYADNLNVIVEFLTGFNVYSLCEWFVNDKATGMKPLMISMGLNKFAYNSANILCALACLLPALLSQSVVACVYIFDDSKASSLSVVLMTVLLCIHLTGLIYVFVSFITSTSYCSTIFIYLILEWLIHNLLRFVLSKTSEQYWPLIIFVASASPYESLRILCNGYQLNRNDGSTQFDPVKGLVSQPTYLIIIAMTFWSMVAFAFAFWFEEVCPWQEGSAVRSWCFCFRRQKGYERFTNTNESAIARSTSKYFEQTPNNHELGIRISHVSKNFNNVPALHDLSLDVYRGETTLLLGHNGAGKTTLMNIILGGLAQDEGSVTMSRSGGANNQVLGVGVCPQTSILDDELNVTEHLELFADIKDGHQSEQERQANILQTIQDVGLASHADKLPRELSGGMKRKLSLAMAFVGRSGILVLDEPSSGLDPDSRMFVWDAIRRYRTDRTVLLSTQHMEEADYLGDRIAILSAGRVVCCGSSIFLNNLFGTGYKLRIECDPAQKRDVLEHVRGYFGRAKFSGELESMGSSSDFVVELRVDPESGQDSELQLIKLLESLETSAGTDLKIKSFGLKSSSIEDVMLNTSKYFSHQLTEATQLTMTPASGHIQTLANCHQVAIPDDSLWATQRRVFCALVIKQLQTYLADWKSIIMFRVLVPALAMWLFVNRLNRQAVEFQSRYMPSITNILIIFHYVYYPTLERATKFKTMQLTSSASSLTYWAAYLAVDIQSAVVASLSLNLLIEYVFHGQILVSKLTLYALTTSATIMFGIAASLFAYILSTCLNNAKASIGYHGLVYSSSVVVFVLLQILKLSLRESKVPRKLQDVFNYFFGLVLPNDAYQFIMYGTTAECYIQGLTECPPSKQDHSILFGYLALIFQIFLYGFVLIFIERKLINIPQYLNVRNLSSFWCCLAKRQNDNENRRQHQIKLDIDSDVLEESTKAATLIRNVPTNLYSTVGANLTKCYVYPNRVVDNLSFTVRQGECFGLLGVNGAGKSTTFSMLVGELKPDSGSIWANGHYIGAPCELDKYRSTLGFDPQANPDISMSSYETLRLMARLRQVNELTIASLVNSVLELLDMGQHAHKYVKNLSGGSKRKLALGMALIGNPKLLALDEPTAGVDPLARRGIWQLLKSLRQQCGASIVISSHAMEECEAICDRISIMARGRLRCIGSFLHLRSKFAQGSTLRVQLVAGTQAFDTEDEQKRRDNGTEQQQIDTIVGELHAELNACVGSSELVKLADKNVNSATFNVATNAVRRSLLFGLMREFSAKHSNISYMVNDSSLEDIFISLAREDQSLDSNA